MYKSISVVILFFGALVVLPFLLSISSEFGKYVVREISYHIIAESVSDHAQTPTEAVELVTGFFFINEIEPQEPFTVVDHTVHTDLIRGVGLCDQRVNGLVTVLDKLDMDARFLIFDCHTIAEISLATDTLIVDPTENIYWEKVSSQIDSASFYWNSYYWKAKMFDATIVPMYKFARIDTCSTARRNDFLKNRKPYSLQCLDKVFELYVEAFGKNYLLCLVDWMSFLGHFKHQNFYSNVLTEKELGVTINREERVYELLRLGDCSNVLPCLWSLDSFDSSLSSTNFLFKSRMKKLERLTERQKKIFSD
jgi:hypothetical protein